MKKISGGIWRCHDFTHMYQKSQSYNVWFLRYKAWQAEFFCHFGLFFALLPLTDWKISLKKWKKHLEISSFYTCIPQMTFVPETWCLVPKIWRYTLLTTQNIKITLVCHKWRSYDWDMAHNRHDFFVILVQFVPFYPTNNLKNWNFEKLKKSLEISFYTCVPRMTIISCMVPEIRSATNRFFLSFSAIFYLPNLLINRKIKIMRNEKTPEDIIILHLCTINYDHMMYGSWDMEHNRHFFWPVFALLTPPPPPPTP